MKLWWVTGLVFAVFAAACGGSDSKNVLLDDETLATNVAATVIAEGFDPNVFTAIGLQLEEVPEGLPQDRFFDIDAYGPSGVWYTAVYGDESFRISSTIGRHPEPAQFTTAITRVRRANSALVKGERNIDVAGADQAFLYGDVAFGRASSVLIIKDDYYVQVLVEARDRDRQVDARNPEPTERYARLVFDRLLQYLEDPDSVTPVPGAPRVGATSGSTD